MCLFSFNGSTRNKKPESNKSGPRRNASPSRRTSSKRTGDFAEIQSQQENREEKYMATLFSEIHTKQKNGEKKYSTASKKAYHPLEAGIKQLPTTYILLRHAEAEHNVLDARGKPKNHIRDPALTTKGKLDCVAKSRAAFMTPDDTRMLSITHIVASPMRRALQTALLYFRPLLLAKPDMKILAMPNLIERGTLAASTGTPYKQLLAEFKDEPIDFSLLREGWEREYLSRNAHVLRKRAREARRQLFSVGERSKRTRTGIGKYVAVVSHGTILRQVAQNERFLWKNAGFVEVRFDTGPEGKTPTDDNYNMSLLPEFSRDVQKKVDAFKKKKGIKKALHLQYYFY